MKYKGMSGVGLLASIGLILVSVGGVYAASNSDFTQAINAGTLATDIVDASNVAVGSPAVAMSAKTFSFSCQSGAGASTGTFGTNTQRIQLSNPDAADNGWTLTLAATAGATSTWDNAADTLHFDYNDAGGSGCTDGADTDSYGGQLTVNPSGGTITTNYSGSSTTGISLGSSTAFVEGTTNSVTIATAANTSADIWRGYITGVALSQTIPAEQAPAADYSENFTVTVTAQ